MIHGLYFFSIDGFIYRFSTLILSTSCSDLSESHRIALLGRAAPLQHDRHGQHSPAARARAEPGRRQPGLPTHQAHAVVATHEFEAGRGDRATRRQGRAAAAAAVMYRSGCSYPHVISCVKYKYSFLFRSLFCWTAWFSCTAVQCYLAFDFGSDWKHVQHETLQL